MKRIESKNHKLRTYEINKISLPCFDDKRCVLGDRIRALAYFHKDSVKGLQKIVKGLQKIVIKTITIVIKKIMKTEKDHDN